MKKNKETTLHLIHWPKSPFCAGMVIANGRREAGTEKNI